MQVCTLQFHESAALSEHIDRYSQCVPTRRPPPKLHLYRSQRLSNFARLAALCVASASLKQSSATREPDLTWITPNCDLECERKRIQHVEQQASRAAADASAGNLKHAVDLYTSATEKSLNTSKNLEKMAASKNELLLREFEHEKSILHKTFSKIKSEKCLVTTFARGCLATAGLVAIASIAIPPLLQANSLSMWSSLDMPSRFLHLLAGLIFFLFAMSGSLCYVYVGAENCAFVKDSLYWLCIGFPIGVVLRLVLEQYCSAHWKKISMQAQVTSSGECWYESSENTYKDTLQRHKAKMREKIEIREEKGAISDSEAEADSEEPLKRYMQPALDDTLQPVHGGLSILTWNIAGVNQNPFEFWMTTDNQAQYLKVVRGFDAVMTNPDSYDQPIGNIFTDKMFGELLQLMASNGLIHTEWLGNYWRQDVRGRKLITDFLLDKRPGRAKLVAKPDKATNTLLVVPSPSSGSSAKREQVCRPTVINRYAGDLKNFEVWWVAWQEFMFAHNLGLDGKKGLVQKKPFELLESLEKNKYRLTEDEAKGSVALQILSLAIFDAALIHLMNIASPDGAWLETKSALLRILEQKNERTIDILKTNYITVDVLCLQEVHVSLAEQIRSSPFGSSHHILGFENADTKKGSNSFVLIRKAAFENFKDVTAQIAEKIQCDCGDLVVVFACHRTYGPIGLASYHGDSTGTETIPVLTALHAGRDNDSSPLFRLPLLVGTDANTHETASKGKLSLQEFGASLSALGITTCWGDRPELEPCRTLCKARTFVQPQFHKGVSFADRMTKCDRSPKDFILFYRDTCNTMQKPWKDNTGKLEYIEDMFLPTSSFPSDHGLLGTRVYIQVEESW